MVTIKQAKIKKIGNSYFFLVPMAFIQNDMIVKDMRYDIDIQSCLIDSSNVPPKDVSRLNEVGHQKKRKKEVDKNGGTANFIGGVQ